MHNHHVPRYETVEELLEAKSESEASMPGWVSQAAYGLGIELDSHIGRRATNYPNIHEFPGVILAKVLGYRTGSRADRLDSDSTDDAAIRQLRTELEVGY